MDSTDVELTDHADGIIINLDIFFQLMLLF